MQKIDHDAELLANKVLSVVFIIFIVSLNGALIFKTVRKPKFFLSPKFMLIISLAIGDIILALFTLVVSAKTYFGDIDMTCVTIRTATIYHYFVINFAYGVGVITLALELVVRYKGKNRVTANLQAPVAFIVSFVPWFLVLIFALPLTMAGFDWDTCTYPKALFPDSRFYAMFGMCDIVPPVVAFIVSLVIMFINLTPRQESSNPWASSVELGNYNSGPVNANQRHNFPVQQPLLNATTTTAYQAEVNSYNMPMQNYPPQQLPFIVSTTQHQFPNNTTNPTREKLLLIVVAIINIVCVLPFGALSFIGSIGHTFTYSILLISFQWIIKLRSVLTPIIWLFDR